MYIVFEGVDGSGKTTMWNRVAGWLKENGKGAVGTYEPQESFNDFLDYAWGRSLDEISNPSASSALYYVLERLMLKQDIKEALDEGHVVLSDRSYISSMVYQDDIDFVKEVNKYALKPDLVIFLDVDAEVAYERLKERDSDVDVSLEDLEWYVTKYRDLLGLGGHLPWLSSHESRICVFAVNANNSEDEVFEMIITCLKEKYHNELHLNSEYESPAVDVVGMHNAVRAMQNGGTRIINTLKDFAETAGAFNDALSILKCINVVEEISKKHQLEDDVIDGLGDCRGFMEENVKKMFGDTKYSGESSSNDEWYGNE